MKKVQIFTKVLVNTLVKVFDGMFSVATENILMSIELPTITGSLVLQRHMTHIFSFQ